MTGCEAALWWLGKLLTGWGAKYEFDGVKGGGCAIGADEDNGGRVMELDPAKVELVGAICVLVSYALAMSSSTYFESFVSKWLYRSTNSVSMSSCFKFN